MEGVPTDLPARDSFVRKFRARAGADVRLSFADFMDLTLYDEDVGYYRAARTRVGRETTADFVTSSTFDRVFGPLVAGAAQTLLEPESPADHVFVEIGAEPGRGILEGLGHSFASAISAHVGDTISVPGRAVVFSNELFDAQPFHRVVFRDADWRELAVTINDEHFVWIECPIISPEVTAIADRLPSSATQGYTIDLPVRARTLLETIVRPSWKGLFIAFDYGRSWKELICDYPGGTGRSYFRHQQGGDLLANPGSQDLTCHVCWDWLEEILKSAGFGGISRSSQESFFLRHASKTVENLLAADPNPFSPVRSQLKQLLHPGLMGQKFEILWGIRS